MVPLDFEISERGCARPAQYAIGRATAKQFYITISLAAAYSAT